MTKSLHISIPRPCHEDWQKMTAAEKGRFCNACQKVVVDFTKLSDDEIINYFKSDGKKTCGRFAPSQLNRDIVIEKNHTPGFNYRFFTAVSLLLGLSMPAIAQNAKQDSAEVVELVLGRVKMTDDAPEFGQTSSYFIIRGNVKDADTDEPLAYASIIVKNSHLKGAVTDTVGNFELKIPVRYKDSALALEIKYIGYESKIIRDIKGPTNTLQVTLNEMVMGEMAGEVIIGTPWQRFKYRVKSFLSRIF